MKQALVTIIIPVWNLWETTRNCLLSLKEHTPLELVRVLVADNGSTDETATSLESLGKSLFGEGFSRLRLPENLGFAKACNLGAQAAETPYILFLNNDTLLTENWLPPLLAELEQDESLAGAGPLLIYPENKLTQHCGIAFTPDLSLSHLYAFFPAWHPAVRKKRRLQAITAAALLMRRDDFMGCCGFFEGFLNGHEDVDLCARLLQNGKYFTCVAASRVVHLESRTPGRKDKDTHNADLLRERSKDVFRPDLVSLAAADGFMVKLNPKLNCILKLPETFEQELNQRFRAETGPNLSDCWAALQANPLWQGGYAILIRMQEQAGDVLGAFELSQLEASFFPNPMSLGRLKKLALAAGRVDAAEIAAKYFDSWLESARDHAGLMRRAQKQLAWAREKGFADIEALYAEWIAAYSRGI